MIVINNYFSGVLKRGIPIYTEELVLQMKKDSMQVCELTCPKVLYPLPAFIHNFLFIFYEQILTPLIGLILKSKFNIYPYNSTSIIDAYLGKSVVIIHDLISLKKKEPFFIREICVILYAQSITIKSRLYIYIKNN